MDKLMLFSDFRHGEKYGTHESKKFSLKKQIIYILYTEGKKTIADLCEPAKVSTPTMAAIMNELTDEGWVKKFGIGDSRGGRRPALYGLNETNKYVVGINFSQRYTRIAIFNLHNEPVGNVHEINEGLDTSEDILPLTKKELDTLLQRNGISSDLILGYGITLPGLIDARKGINYSYPQFAEKPLTDTFRELFGGPAFVEHDTKAMAVGESRFGLAKNKYNVLCLNIGTGIGAGMILNGELYHGHSGFSGEFGHIQMQPGGELCYCGKIGCLETVASGTAMIKKAKYEMEHGKNSIIKTYVHGDFSRIRLHTIINAAKEGDQFAIELIEESGEYLARGIAILVHLFNPEAIIIGGDISTAGHLILDPIQHKLNKYVITKLRQDTNILLSNLMGRAGLLGTIPIVMARIFSTSK